MTSSTSADRMHKFRRNLRSAHIRLSAFRNFPIKAWKFVVSCLMTVVPDDEGPYEPSSCTQLEDKATATAVDKPRNLDEIVSNLEAEKQMLTKKALSMLIELTAKMNLGEVQSMCLETRALELEKTSRMFERVNTQCTKN